MLHSSLRRLAAGSPSSRVARAMLVLTVGLTIQAALVAWAIPALAQSRSTLSLENLAFSNVITSTTRGAANIGVGDLWTPEYEIQFDSRGVYTDTVVVGQAGPGLELLEVHANQGRVEFSGHHLTVTNLTADVLRTPLVIAPILRAREAGLQTQRLGVIFPGFTPTVYTDTLVAQETAPELQLHREYPAVLTFGSPLTETWQISRPLAVLTETVRFSGRIRQGVYQQVAADSGRCAVRAAAFRCVVGALGPGLPAAHVALTAMALEVGQVDQIFRASAPAQAITVRTQTIVQETPAFLVTIMAPDSRASAVGPAPGTFTAAILSSTHLDAPGQIDRESIAFGPSGTERSVLFCEASDVDRDRRADLVCRFDATAAGFRRGDDTGVLTARTFSGVPLRGTAPVQAGAR